MEKACTQATGWQRCEPEMKEYSVLRTWYPVNRHDSRTMFCCLASRYGVCILMERPFLNDPRWCAKVRMVYHGHIKGVFEKRKCVALNASTCYCPLETMQSQVASTVSVGRST